jgi:hypothetical protein
MGVSIHIFWFMILSGEILRPALPLRMMRKHQRTLLIISFEHIVTVVVLTSIEELQVWFAGPDSGACHVAYLFGGAVLEVGAHIHFGDIDSAA